MLWCSVYWHLQYHANIISNWTQHISIISSNFWPSQDHRMEEYIFHFLEMQKTCKYFFYFVKIQSIWALGHSWLSLIIDKSIISKIFRDQDHLIDLMTWTHRSGPTLAGSGTGFYIDIDGSNLRINHLRTICSKINRQHWTRSIILNAYWDFYSQSSLHWKALDLVLWVFVHILYKHQYQF